MGLRFILMPFFVAMFSVQAFAFEPWQYAGGNILGFVLPDRPVCTAGNYQKLLDSPREYSQYGKPPSLSANTCPHITALYQTVFNELVEKNSLSQFVQSGPGMNLFISCKEVIFATYAKTTKYNGVVIGDIMLEHANFVDEVAFVIAHEIAHVILGHTEIMWDLDDLKHKLGVDSAEYKKAERDEVQKQEFDADRWAVILAANAGYDIFAGVSFMESFALRNPQRTILPREWEEWLYDDGHGTTEMRKARIQDIAQSMHRPGKALADPLKLNLFTEAKNEFLERR